jgi:hypothetical protein
MPTLHVLNCVAVHPTLSRWAFGDDAGNITVVGMHHLAAEGGGEAAPPFSPVESLAARERAVVSPFGHRQAPTWRWFEHLPSLGIPGVTAYGKCRECGYGVNFDPGLGEKPPERCPRCGAE